MSGWHIDGTFRPSPYAYSIYHMNVVPKKGGDTMFIPLTELIEKYERNLACISLSWFCGVLVLMIEHIVANITSICQLKLF